MNSRIITYLRKYSTNEVKINQLLVSSFLHYNGISVDKNLLLKTIVDSATEKVKRDVIDFTSILSSNRFPLDFEHLIELFEFILSPEDKIVTGAVYTPKYIREYIIANTLGKIEKEDLCSMKIADISCGCGGFLLSAAQELRNKTGKSYSEIFKRNIYGLDIKAYSVERTKILLSILALSEGEDVLNFEFNLSVGDALNFDWKSTNGNHEGFDFVIGNPPYVCSRNIENSTREYLDKWVVCSTGHPDLYIPFFQIGLENLRPNGKLGYITVNSFFKSLNGRALREYFKRAKSNITIIDFGTRQVFAKKSTYTCICLIEKSESNSVKYIRWEDERPLDEVKEYSTVYYSKLDAKKGWNLQNNEVVAQIERVGKPFDEVYQTRNGIATLKNSIYVFKPVDEDKRFYYLQNGETYKIERGICKNIVNPNGLISQQNIKSLYEKLLFPYEFQNGRAEILSGNFMKEKYPFALKYLEKKRKILSTRDKGKAEKLYEKWFAFGRRQCLERFKYKLFFPHITPITPNFAISRSTDLFFYNGLAVVSNDIQDILVLKKILQSKIFWYYIKNTSKPYSSNFYSLSRNYIKNFGIPSFNSDEVKYLIGESDQKKIDQFLESKYEVKI